MVKSFSVVNEAEVGFFWVWIQTQFRGSYHFEIRLIIFFAAKDGEALYSQQKQDQELTLAQIMNSLLLIQTEIEESRENY